MGQLLMVATDCVTGQPNKCLNHITPIRQKHPEFTS